MSARRRLILVGAGGFLHEVLWLTTQIPEDKRDWELAGFLDDSPDKARESLRHKMVDLPVFGDTASYTPRAEDCFCITIGTPRSKLAVAAALAARGAQFVNLAHPSLTVMQHAAIGTGCIFMQRTMVGPFVQLGSFVTLNNNSGFGHDSIGEDGVTLSSCCDVTAGAIIRRGAFLGSNAVVLPGAEVGEFAVVGAGSVVLKKVKPGITVMGVPAREFC